MVVENGGMNGWDDGDIYMGSRGKFSLHEDTHPIHFHHQSTALLTTSSKSPLEMPDQLGRIRNVHRGKLLPHALLPCKTDVLLLRSMQ
jgi:hypothetical protein